VRTSIPFCLLRNGGFQALHFLVLFQELVEQHVVDLFVVDGLDFTILAVHHELGIDLCNLLGDQTILSRAFPVAVELKVTGFEPVQRFAGLVHRLNVVFDAPDDDWKTPTLLNWIDIYCFLGAGIANRLIEDTADEAGVIKDCKRTVTRCRRSRCSY